MIKFKIKKKSYSSPKIKEYGTFAEYIKGSTGNDGNSDSATYYAAAHS